MKKYFPLVTYHAKKMRQHPTVEESLLWSRLRNNKLGFRFRRQQEFLPYIVDFYCHKLKLAIELDGSQHGTERNIKYDERRTKYLESLGITVLRFWNYEVRKNINDVIETIIKFIN